MKRFAAAITFFAILLTAAAQTPSAKRTIGLKFDYDFSRTPACTATIQKNCIQQFNVYDMSAGAKNRIKIFSIPVPPGAKGPMKGISGSSPALVFEVGTHFLGVAAQMADGSESDPTACQATVQIAP